MPDIGSLRTLGAQLDPPPFREVEEMARRRTRRAAVSTSVLGALAVVVATFLLVADLRGRGAAPEPVRTPTPTPSVSPSPSPEPSKVAGGGSRPTHASDTWMTPREVVTAADATLVLTGVSADDPDFRMAVWEASCHWCPWNPDETRGPPGFYGLAITTDGFATARYVRPPFDAGLIWHVESPGPGLLLLDDVANGPEWLVRDDATVTRLTRIAEQHPAADPRYWHECHGVVDDRYDHLDPTGWCALDPGNDASYQWPSPWLVDAIAETRSGANPHQAAEPWGLVWVRPNEHVLPAPVLVAYWYVDGVRHTQELGPDASWSEGAVANMRRGEMAVWSLDEHSRNLTIHSSADRGATWQTTRLKAPSSSHSLALFRTSDGALLALQLDAYWKDGSEHEGEGMKIWRADSLRAGRFEVVHGVRSRIDARGYEGPAFTEVGDRIWSGGLWSDDDGRTWKAVLAWR